MEEGEDEFREIIDIYLANEEKKCVEKLNVEFKKIQKKMTEEGELIKNATSRKYCGNYSDCVELSLIKKAKKEFPHPDEMRFKQVSREDDELLETNYEDWRDAVMEWFKKKFGE